MFLYGLARANLGSTVPGVLEVSAVFPYTLRTMTANRKRPTGKRDLYLEETQSL